MATPVVDYLKQDSDMTMHDHTEADLGAILDSRYIKVAGGNSASNIIIENDTSDGDITFKVNDGGVDKTVMTLDGATGNVGIGTTSPAEQLHLVSATNSRIRMQSGTSSQSVLQWYAGASPAWEFYANNTGTGTANLGFYQNSTGLVKMQLTESGAVNIGYIASKGYAFNVKSDGDIDMVVYTGNVGIGTTSPTNILSLGGNSARTFWLERHTTANTAGNTLTVTAGGATSGATDKAGGDLILTPGLSTGTGESGVQIKGVPAGSTGTTDGTQTLMIQVLGNKLSFYNQTPVVRPTALTPTGTYVLNTGDAGSDTEITLMRTRINELESKLQGLGLLT